MSRRALSWIIGGGIAIVALVLILTAVPVVAGAPNTGTETLTSEFENDTFGCAELTIDANLA